MIQFQLLLCSKLDPYYYRVYTITEYRRQDDENREGDQEFYRLAESSAVGMASAVMALSKADAR